MLPNSSTSASQLVSTTSTSLVPHSRNYQNQSHNNNSEITELVLPRRPSALLQEILTTRRPSAIMAALVRPTNNQLVHQRQMMPMG